MPDKEHKNLLDACKKVVITASKTGGVKLDWWPAFKEDVKDILKKCGVEKITDKMSKFSHTKIKELGKKITRNIQDTDLKNVKTINHKSIDLGQSSGRKL